MKYSLHIKTFGQNALLIEWPEQVDPNILRDMLRLRTALQRAEFKAPHWDLVPAYRSMAVISNTGPLDAAHVKGRINELYTQHDEAAPGKNHLWHLPVCYDTDFGPDLVEVAQNLGITRDQLVAQRIIGRMK